MRNWYGRVLGMLLGTAIGAFVVSPACAMTRSPVLTETPQLSIAVANGQTSARSGQDLNYTISVHNLGTSAVRQLVVTQTVPTELRLNSSTPLATTGAGEVSWRVNLKARSMTTLHTRMTVRAVPADLLRLATVVCAGVSAEAAPLVCAAHSDQLPAGAAEAAAADRPVSSRQTWRPGALGIGLTVAIAGLGVATLAWRRRHVRRQAAQH